MIDPSHHDSRTSRSALGPAPSALARGAGIAALALLLATAGCGSCDTTGGQTNGDGSSPPVDGTPTDGAPGDGIDDRDGTSCEGDGCETNSCSGTPCGENQSLCCTGEEICVNNGCEVPGQDCEESADCPEDKYCEPTVGKCVSESDDSNECTFRPEPGEFTPSREGSIPDVETNGNTYNRSIATPAVADIDADGTPEIAVPLYYGGLGGALIAVFNGEDQTLVDYGAVEEIKPNSAGLAVGQLDDSTPELEIVAPQDGGGLVALKLDANGNLSTWWSTDEGDLADVDTESAPSIADIDGGGDPEIVFGFSVVDAEGNVWNGINEGPAGGQRSGTGLTSVVDLDGTDGMNGNRDLEIVAGNRAMKTDGSMLWDRSGDLSDGFSAVGDFGNDGDPDVVTVTQGEVYVLDGETGNTEFGPESIPGGGEGGPPTVADFDNDGFVEFSAAGQGRYTVYDLGCSSAGASGNNCASGRSDGILWDKEVQDLSSSRTGSSVFDFEGDGKDEVVYNDECFLRVFDGENGDVLYERANTSRTGSEYPIVVDVDGDNNSEIVVSSNNDQIDRDQCEENFENYPTGGTTGLFVYADADDRWVPTRSIWNQHTYHITNVQNDGSIPTQEDRHYQQSLTNSFRLNIQRDNRFGAPDLIVTELRGTCTEERKLEIEATVANQGKIGVAAGVPVGIYAGTSGNVSRVATIQTTRPLRPGARETLTYTWEDPTVGQEPDWTIRAVADSDEMEESSERECKEENNAKEATGGSCPCAELGKSCESNAQCCSGTCNTSGQRGNCIGG